MLFLSTAGGLLWVQPRGLHTAVDSAEWLILEHEDMPRDASAAHGTRPARDGEAPRAIGVKCTDSMHGMAFA